MSTENRSDPTGTAATENLDLAERIAELYEQGILIGGEGARGYQQKFPHVPGAYRRFLEREARAYAEYRKAREQWEGDAASEDD